MDNWGLDIQWNLCIVVTFGTELLYRGGLMDMISWLFQRGDLFTQVYNVADIDRFLCMKFHLYILEIGKVNLAITSFNLCKD